MLIRHADPGRDAAAIADIYAPYVRDTVISLEERPPDADEMEGRMQRITERYPWLIAERDGEVAGYAYGSAHHERAASFLVKLIAQASGPTRRNPANPARSGRKQR